MKQTLWLTVVAALVGACSDAKSFRSVEIVGLPCPEGRLVTPIVIEAVHGDGRLQMSYVGAGSTTNIPTPAMMSLEKDALTKLRVRIGRCRAQPGGPIGGGFNCDHPDWEPGGQDLAVDTRDPAAKVVLRVTGDHPCR